MSGEQAAAFTIDYDTDRDQRLRECDEHRWRGRGDEAVACYETLVARKSVDSDIGEDDADALVLAEATAALGRTAEANRLYRDATAGSRDPALRTAWGRLYLETHQISDAEALFREALVIDSGFLPARLGLAEAMSEGFESRARETLARLVEEHPDSVKALLLLARIELELQNVDRARVLLNRALAATRTQGLPPLEVFALQAGADLLEDKSMLARQRAALAWNPRYGDVYAIPAHFYIITYRYREAVDLYRKAVALDPSLATAQRDLGINLLRIDDLFGARHHLELAYALDPFDAMTVNTLKLVDKLDDMRVSVVDVAAEDDPQRIIGRALVRLDREDADSLEPYVEDLVTRAIRTFSERYDFELRQPMIVELYHDHDDFGVRTVSTPGIGLLGVTFGYLTAMDSPKARAAGEFHWGSTLWHEIAHVFTIEATNHRLPRWFSEGLSVYEEWSTGPLGDRELSLDTLTAIARQQLLGIEDLDQGFVRPSYQGQVQVSYMQAGLLCDFIASRWGHEALVTMLRTYAGLGTTREALELATGFGPEDVDEAFTEWLDGRYGELVKGLDDYRIAFRQLERAREMGDTFSIVEVARDVVRRYPDRVGAGNAWEILAAAQREEGDETGAIETLLEWQRRGGHAPDTLASLVDDLRAAGREAEAARVAEALNWVMPYARDTHAFLGAWYLEEGEPERALREFDALLGLQPEDPALARYGMAQAARRLGDDVAARRQVLEALESAPFYRPAQTLLLELVQASELDTLDPPTDARSDDASDRLPDDTLIR